MGKGCNHDNLSRDTARAFLRGRAMASPIESQTFKFEGREFEASIYFDDASNPPWIASDCHGSVRFIGDREPLQKGEVILCDMRRGRFVYNFGAALLKAWRDGWGLSPEHSEALARRLGKKPTKAQIRAESVRQDMNYLRGYCMEDWHYIGASVRLIGPNGEPQGEQFGHSVWGVESCTQYWREVADNLASEILQERRKAWRAALSEARARRYWASRDVLTIEGAE